MFELVEAQVGWQDDNRHLRTGGVPAVKAGASGGRVSPDRELVDQDLGRGGNLGAALGLIRFEHRIDRVPTPRFRSVRAYSGAMLVRLKLIHHEASARACTGSGDIAAGTPGQTCGNGRPESAAGSAFSEEPHAVGESGHREQERVPAPAELTGQPHGLRAERGSACTACS